MRRNDAGRRPSGFRIPPRILDLGALVVRVLKEYTIKVGDKRHVQYIDPYRSAISIVLVPVPRPWRSKDQVTCDHGHFFAIDCCDTTIMIGDYSDGRDRMSVWFCDFTWIEYLYRRDESAG
jgi:hypothetical protein